jgi:hypothetical protein
MQVKRRRMGLLDDNNLDAASVHVSTRTDVNQDFPLNRICIARHRGPALEGAILVSASGS